MPPPGHEPLLRAVCADPEDDTVRLVYADWLDEHGDPDRAEFIRLQVAGAGKPRGYAADYFRAERLLEQNRDRWLGELPKLTGVLWDDTFRRGFVDAVRIEAGGWLQQHRTALFAATPVLALTLTDAGEGTLAKAFELPELGRITELYLSRCRVSLGRFGVVARSPALKRLRTLGVRGRLTTNRSRATLTDAEARQLAETPFLPALEEVYFDGPLSPEAADLLRGRYKTVRYWGSRG